VLSALTSVFYDDFWFKSFLSSKDLTLILCHHPELMFIQSGVKNMLYNSFTTDFFYSYITSDFTENYITPVIMFPQFVLTIFVMFLFSLFLFDFFNMSTNNENIIDHDFLINTLLIETEEEIGSLDDMIIGGILFFYVFG
jgi:hypothetical protein